MGGINLKRIKKEYQYDKTPYYTAKVPKFLSHAGTNPTAHFIYQLINLSLLTAHIQQPTINC